MEFTTSSGNIIIYSIYDSNCHITNSFEITEDNDKKEFIQYLQEEYPQFVERVTKSYLREWKAHNILYRHNFQPKRTKETDLNVHEYLCRRIGYAIICFFCRE